MLNSSTRNPMSERWLKTGVDEFTGPRSCQGICMFSDDDVRLICPHCCARFVVQPEPGETVVRCPNPSCATPFDLSSQKEEPDDWLSRKLWPYATGILLGLILGILQGC